MFNAKAKYSRLGSSLLTRRLGHFSSGEKRARDGCIRRLMIVSTKSFVDYSNEFSSSFANYLNFITPKRD